MSITLGSPCRHVKSVAVVGAGVVGLSVALRLKETWPGLQVKVIANEFLQQTTSYGAGGLWEPYALSGKQMFHITSASLHEDFPNSSIFLLFEFLLLFSISEIIYPVFLSHSFLHLTRHIPRQDPPMGTIFFRLFP
jgi:hypothetical protein